MGRADDARAVGARQDARNAEPGGKLKDQPTPRGRAGARGGRIQQAFRDADRDGDGKLNAEEFARPTIFKDVDQNGDGFATMEELRA